MKIYNLGKRETVFKKFLCGCVVGLEVLVGVALFVLGVYLTIGVARGEWQSIIGAAIYLVLICGVLGAIS